MIVSAPGDPKPLAVWTAARRLHGNSQRPLAGLASTVSAVLVRLIVCAPRAGAASASVRAHAARTRPRSPSARIGRVTRLCFFVLGLATLAVPARSSRPAALVA